MAENGSFDAVVWNDWCFSQMDSGFLSCSCFFSGNNRIDIYIYLYEADGGLWITTNRKEESFITLPERCIPRSKLDISFRGV